MKELSIEEKAKRYDEAIERAKGLIDFCSDSELKTLENVFPELSESEDEKIRKELIKGFNNLDKRAVWYNGITYGQILAWLEKQGEQKPKTEYIYLKFREGDTIQKITGDKDIVTIAEVDTEAEEYRLTNSEFLPFKYEHLWYLVEQKPIPIFRVGETIIAKDGTNIIKEPFHIDKIEDDYYWDGENTILVCNQDDWELVEQKTTEWSEEDAKHFLRCLGYIEAYVEPRKDDVRWFKELKDRVQPKNVEWSEADEFIRLTLLKIVKNEMKQHGNVGLGNGIITSDIIVWLKKLGKQKSLDEVAKEITKNKETAISFLKSCGIMNDNGELADEYKTEQCEKKSAENVELKFKVGDLIKLSKEPKYPAREIISIKNDGYYFDSAVYLPFERQDDWELVDTIQNSAWSKEDENTISEAEEWLDTLCDYLKDSSSAYIPNVRVVISNLKSLKCRVQPKLKQGWTEEDENNINSIVSRLEVDISYWESRSKTRTNEDKKLIEWLKSLRPQLIREWSEEDDRNLSIAIQYVFQRGYLSTVNWLKSLKERYTWKPSEYQLNSLQVAINIIGEQTLTGTDLKKLLEQLNKL